MRFLSYEVYGNATSTWLITLGLVVAVWIALVALKWFIVNRIGAWAKRTSTSIDDFFVQVVSRTGGLFLVIVALALAPIILSGAQVLILPPAVAFFLHRLLVIALLVQATVWGTQVIDFAIARWIHRNVRGDHPPEHAASLRTTMSAVRMASRIVLYSLIVLLIIDNFGVDVTALVAGLGVGGIAVALAVQNILGDLFSSFSIVMDKPFVLGDFVIVGNEMGTVEKIGLKTTRIKSISGEQIVFSNTDLLQSRVRNYKRMADRRVLFKFGVLYQTPVEKLEQIPAMVRQIIEGQEKTRFDRAHFQSFGDSSLNFEVVYFVTSPEYNTYAAIEHQINLTLCRRFAEAGIGFAYPTRSIIVEQMPAMRLDQDERPASA